MFTFTLNVMVTDSEGRWISKPVSVVCSGLTWTHREITCEEDYMEVRKITLTDFLSSYVEIMWFKGVL